MEKPTNEQFSLPKVSTNDESSFFDIRLEDSVIGACLLGNQEAIGEMITSGLTAKHFTQPAAALTFSAIVSMFERGELVDLLTVNHTIREENKDVSIASYLVRTTSSIYSPAHIKAHCKKLHELYIKRETSNLGSQLVLATKQKSQDSILDEIQKLTNNLFEKKYEADIQPVGNYVELSEKEMQRRIELASKGELSGITTGLSELNNLINGWQNSALNIIAGRPGMGKTSIALHFALAAAKQGKSVCIYSLEMSRVRLVDRLIMAVAENLNDSNFRKGEMTESDILSFNQAKEKLKKLPIYIDDQAVCSTNYIRANAMKMKLRNQCDMIIIDYLQLTDMTSNTNKQYNREQQVSKTSREFKILAKELDVPVLLLSQLSRAVETRGSKKPHLSDLRESGSIEQDADIVAFIYRPEYYEEEGYTRYDEYGNFTCGIACIIIAKQRDGGLGEVQFCYNRSLTKIWDCDERNINLSSSEINQQPLSINSPTEVPKVGNQQLQFFKNLNREDDYLPY